VQFFDASVEHYQGKYYGEEVRSFMTVRHGRVLEFVDRLGLPRGASVLDAGCGPGYLLEALAARQFRVAGLDASQRMVETARRRVVNAKPAFSPRFKQASIDRLPYRSETFDLVCSTGVIEYLPQDGPVLGEFYRVLKPGGHLIVATTNAWSPINWLESVIETAKRQSWLRVPFNAVWQRLGQRPVLPRHFTVRRHSPRDFREELKQVGFQFNDSVYFYFLPWPHPFDQFLPATSAALGALLERFARSPIGPLAEGYLVLGARPA
jgi:ubiquinone/menaquinone biosynthesis C-methylase UbiE